MDGYLRASVRCGRDYFRQRGAAAAGVHSGHRQLYAYAVDGNACNQYPADDSGVLGGALRFWVESGCQPSGGDVDGSGCVDDADLLAVLFAFGNSGSGLDEDVNCDGTVDDADLLEVLFNFGSGC